MTDPINFTKKVLQALPWPPTGKLAYYRDTKVPGLLICVTPTGTKSFQVYRRLGQGGKPVRVTLGRFPDMTPYQARDEARNTLSDMAGGTNPNQQKKAAAARSVTLAEVFDAYLRSRQLKPRTVADYRAVLRVAFGDWQKRPVVSITRDLVQRRHEALGKRSRVRADNAMRVLRAVLNFAAGTYEDTEGNPILTDNPTRRLTATRAWYRVERRRTLIKPHQLAHWFEAVLSLQAERATGKAEVVRDYLLFLLLTGTRREEAAKLRWQHVDLTGRTVTLVDTKNREPHELPLSDFLLELLRRRQSEAGDSPFVFPGSGKSGHLIEPRRWMTSVTSSSGVAFTLHDLRRTFATIAESLDIPAYALKRLLNHKSGADVTAGYVVIDTERLREPMQRITDFILKAAGVKETADVMELAAYRRPL